MLGALLYLRWTSFRNWLRSRVRRLRQPKYLIGAIVGVAYFYFFFFRPMGSAPGSRGGKHAAAAEAMAAASATLPLDWLPVTTACGALGLLAFMTLMWVVPMQRAALGFSEAEVAFLFPAPLTRRALVHFRLLSSQFRSLVGATVMMLFSSRWSVVGGSALTHALGWWFIFASLNLHYTGANFTLTRLNNAGVGAWRRRVLVFIVIAAVVGISLARLETAASGAAAHALDLRPLADGVVQLGATAPLAWLLWPLTLVIGPFLALDARDFLLALGPALAVIAAHYFWVVRSAVAFEDASIDYAQKRAARIAAWRSGDRRIGNVVTKARRAPFRLASTGRPELAFFWKNLLSAWPYFTMRLLAIAAAIIVAAWAWARTQPGWRDALPGIGIAAAMFGAYALIVGPQFARQDIRSDLGHADVLKTYPLRGWQILAGELLTPIAILTGVLWLALLTAALTFAPPGARFAWLTPQMRLVAGVCFAAIMPALVALQLLVPNAAALLFPGWFQTSRTRGGGPEVIGQRMIFFFAQLLTMLLALVPAAGLAALLIFTLHWFIGPLVAIGIATAAVCVVLLAEVGCGLWWLGQRFENLDLSAELRA